MLPNFRPERGSRGHSHVPPDWVDHTATFFLTINCQERNIPQLTTGNVPERLLDSVDFLYATHRWRPEIFLLMPDHLHALVSFSWEPSQGLNRVVADWKRYTARNLGVLWQRDFHDHRIRSEADHQDKWAYIRENPVRKGLVESYDLWPHVWFPTQRGW